MSDAEKLRFGPESRTERLGFFYNSEILRVERRTDNGVAGSGIVYDVDVHAIYAPDKVLVTFTPKHQKTYKQGLVLPFPIPDFNIQSFLSSGALDYELELNSIYPADSIKANFERLLYREPLLQDALVETKVYPYKNGSKIVLYVSIYGSMSVDGVIDLNAKLAEIKKQIQRVINS